jgi:hypothetical protein
MRREFAEALCADPDGILISEFPPRLSDRRREAAAKLARLDGGQLAALERVIDHILSTGATHG